MKNLKCGCPEENLKYNDKYDAHYCKIHDMWLEDKCKDEDCEFCNHRPEKPKEDNI